ncbi:MAG TPA: carboxypeptidase regulatory-like domain-containing protein [Candidatus Saccharimonadaceae bacterium]|nr:carboxypeptidase regulatory-like domain-containing protein [Candidatus Saccharimonadaceae bacterium]
MNHLSASQLSARLDDALPASERDRVDQHLAGCAKCRDAMAELAVGDRALAQVLEHDPGDAYFDSFERRVQDRLAAGAVGGAEARARGGLARWFANPRNLSIAGAAAALVVGAGIVLMTSHEVEMPTLRRTAPERRVTADEAAPSAPAPAESKQAPAGENAAREPGARAGAPATAMEGAPRARTESFAEPAPSTNERADQGAAPGRAYEVRRGPNGEDVAVNPPRAPFAPPRSTYTPAPPGEPTRVGGLPRYAQPLGAVGPMTSQAPATKAAPAPQTSVGKGSLSAPSMPVAPAPQGDGLALEKSNAPSPAPALALPPRSGAALKGPALPTPGTITAPATRVRSQERDARQAPGAAEEKHANALVLDEQGTTANGELCGRVLDNWGRSIAGAEVTIAEAGITQRTDATGHFCIRAPAGDRTVVVMAVGYQEVRRPVTVAAASAEMAITLNAVPVLSPPAGGASMFAKPSGPTYGFVSPPATPQASAPPSSGMAGLLDNLQRRATAIETLDALMDEAQKRSADAARDGSATHFDAAAHAWERVLPRVAGQPAESEVRFHVAEERHLAWEAGPTPLRAVAARSALTSYIERAPAGGEKDKAERWLRALPR